MGKLCYVVFSLIITMESAETVIQTYRGLLQVDSIVKYYNSTLRRQRRSVTETFSAHSTYLANSGLTCYVCHPGFYKKSDCTGNGTTAVCGPCPNGQYSTTYNIAIRCAYCSPQCIVVNAVVHSPCNSTGDISCQCKKGYYNNPKGGGELICFPHSTCPAGTGIGIPGTANQDTQCRPCSLGTFSTESSIVQCIPCTTCDSNKFIKTTCSRITDTVCENKEEDDLTIKIVVPIVIVVVVVVVVVVVGLVGLVVVYLWRTGALKKFKKWLCSSSESENAIVIGNPNDNNELQYAGNEGDQEAPRPTAIEITFPPNTENRSWVKVFRKISNEINIEEWRSVIRHLLDNYCDALGAERKIDEICYDYQNDGVKEKIYRCLLAWSTLSDEVYLDDIISSLEVHGMLGLADDLNRNYASLLKDYHAEGEYDIIDQE